MTLQECTALLTPFAVGIGAAVDTAMFNAYARVLKDVTPPLLARALELYENEGVRFLPGAPEMKAKCEIARRQLLAVHPYEGCADCEQSKGFIDVKVDGKWYSQPCPCKARHAAKLARLGIGAPVAQIAAEVSGESEAVYPMAAQLPSGIRQRLEAIAGQKVLR